MTTITSSRMRRAVAQRALPVGSGGHRTAGRGRRKGGDGALARVAHSRDARSRGGSRRYRIACPPGYPGYCWRWIKTPMAPAGLSALMKAIDSHPEPVTRLGTRLLAHRVLRMSERSGAQWSEIRDPKTWVIPEERRGGACRTWCRYPGGFARHSRRASHDDRGRVLAHPRLALSQNPCCSMSNSTLRLACTASDASAG